MKSALADMGHLTIDGQDIAYTVHRRPKRRRTLSLYVDAANKIRLLVPLRTSHETIRRIFDDRRHWIARRLSELQSATILSPQTFEDGTIFYYLGAAHALRLTRDALSPQGCHATSGELNVNLHSSTDTEAREDARLEIQLWYKKKAKELLKERTDYWSTALGLKYRSMKIGSPLRRWGSCSSVNDIRYNWRVILAAPELIDYLVVHELCHIAHKDHSKRFWALLASAIPDWKQRRDQLRHLDPAFVL
jgi:predicted metal-dependent hydrolase